MDLLDIIRDVAIPVIIGILSLMSPILLEALSRIDNKYNSVILVKAFKTETIYRLFVFMLIATILLLVMWCLNIPRIVDIPMLNYFIDNSASFLLLGATLFLTLLSLGIIRLLTIYYVPSSLLKRFINKYNKAKDKEFYFNCISKLFNYSLTIPDDALTRSSWAFISEQIIKRRGDNSEYPPYIYNAVYEADDLLCKRESNTVISFQGTAFFPLLLECRNEISEKLYKFLWSSLLQFIFYDKTTYIYNYWKVAHTYYLNHFSKYYYERAAEEVSDENGTIEARALRFREFHYALGGLLVKQKRYNLLVKLLAFTHSFPPTYLLVPERMSTLVSDYIYISRDVVKDAFHWEINYPYPDVDGISASSAIQGYIMRFFAILFLRQYTLPQYLLINDPLTMPEVPKSVSDKKYVYEQLRILQKYVKEYRSDNDLMISLGFEDLYNDDWFERNGKVIPEQLIDNYCSAIAQAEHAQVQSQSPNPGAIEIFKNKSADIVAEAFGYCEKFMVHEKESNVAYKSTTIRNAHQLLDKAAFCVDQGIAYVNTMEITAQSVAEYIRYFSLNTFILFKKSEITLRLLDAFECVQRLLSRHADLKVFAVGVNMEYLKHNLKCLLDINGQWFYNSVEIIPLDGNRLIYQKIIVVKECDLPVLTYENLPNNVISKYDLSLVDDIRKIYASILDLNDSQYEDIRQEIAETDKGIDNLSKKVLACVDVNPHFNYKANAKVLMINIFDEFTNKGAPQRLDEINDIWECKY